MIDDNNIINIFYKNNKINSHLTRQSWLDIHTDIYQYLLSRFDDYDNIIEVIYRIKNHIEVRPTCIYCGGRLTFKSTQFGFRQFCSVQCSKKFIKEAAEVTDITIILNDVIQNNQLNKNKLQEKYLKEHGYYNLLKDIYPNAKSIAEKIYCLYHNLEFIPYCIRCGKFAQFKNFQDGYDLFCSNDCLIKNSYSNKIITDQDIIDLIFPNNILNKAMISIHTLKNFHIYDYLQNRYLDSNSIAETLYRIKNHIEVRPICSICGNKVKFKSIAKGFATCCSKTCYNQIAIKNNVALSQVNDDIVKDIFKQRVKRDDLSIAQTGLTSYLKNRFFDTSNLQESLYRIENDINVAPTCLNCGSTIKFNNGYKETCCSYCTTHLKAKRKYKELYNLDIDFDNKLVTVYNYCDMHSIFSIGKQTFFRRLYKNDNLCPICNPLPISSLEKSIIKILKKHNIFFEQHNHSLIKYEIDLYLPDYVIGIECNGVYWHKDDGTIYSSGDFKYKLCQENNIRLLTFWEDDIYKNINIIEDIILSAIGLNKKIYARNCSIKNVNLNVANKFLINNSLIYKLNSEINIGLYYKDKLVQLITFNSNDKIYEMTNVVSKNKVNIVGGFSKLLFYFMNIFEWNQINAYIEKDYETSYAFEQCGFIFSKDCGPYKIFYDHSKQVKVTDYHSFSCNRAGKLQYILKNV